MASTIRVALSLVGSAILLFSCDDSGKGDATTDPAYILSEYSEGLSVVKSRNGRRSYRFAAPLLEGYTLSPEPYREFRKGVEVTTYQDDSLTTVDAVMTSDYAIYYEKRELWEARGNVEVHKADGTNLYTQQLFWDARTGKIYSNVDTKIEQHGGRNVGIGEGFESDEEFRDWRFRRSKNRFEVEIRPTESDSTATGQPAAERDAAAVPARRPGDDPLGLRPAPERPLGEEGSADVRRRGRQRSISDPRSNNNASNSSR